MNKFISLSEVKYRNVNSEGTGSYYFRRHAVYFSVALERYVILGYVIVFFIQNDSRLDEQICFSIFYNFCNNAVIFCG